MKDNFPIQFQGEPHKRIPRVHQIVENLAFYVVLDGLNYFSVKYVQHVL